MPTPRSATAESVPHFTPRHVAVTCERDGRTHYVDDVEFATSLTAATGDLTGLCGRRLLVAALVAPPGPLCPVCRATLPAPGPTSR